MGVTNELLSFLNKFNFNELSERGYKPLDLKDAPFLWTHGNKIILPRLKKIGIQDFADSPKENFFPEIVKEINGNLQKRMFVNYFTALDEKKDLLWEFYGFLGFRFEGKPEYYGFFMNSPQIIEDFILSSSMGVKEISRSEKSIFLFETDNLSSAPNTDSKLINIEKYVLSLKKVMASEMPHKLDKEKAVISRYHPLDQQLKAMDFVKQLTPAPAEEVIDAYGENFFMNYVKPLR